MQMQLKLLLPFLSISYKCIGKSSAELCLSRANNFVKSIISLLKRCGEYPVSLWFMGPRKGIHSSIFWLFGPQWELVSFYCSHLLLWYPFLHNCSWYHNWSVWNIEAMSLFHYNYIHQKLSNPEFHEKFVVKFRYDVIYLKWDLHLHLM